MRLGPCAFVLPFLLERIAASSHEAADHCRLTPARDRELREGRARPSGAAVPAAAAGWCTPAANGSTLPGDVVRTAGDRASGDAAVDEAADGATSTLSMYADAFSRSSNDDQAPRWCRPCTTSRATTTRSGTAGSWPSVTATGRSSTGSGQPVDVVGHEFTHAVTQLSAGLTYQDQPGARNESVPDCFGTCLEQRVLGQTAEDGDWLGRAGIFVPGVQARGLSDMANPGTAYDDPTLGQDPQVGDMSAYVDTTRRQRRVHINSGIPNRAFYLAATAIGGHVWEGAGPIWYAALTAST